MSDTNVQPSSGDLGFTGVLTIVFVLLKVFGVVSWSWWIVFLPVMISVGIGFLVLAVAVAGLYWASK